MAISWGITFDCHDAQRQAAFWKVALGYVDAPPPTGWESWEDWARHFEVPEEELDDGASLVDPDGVQPPVGFLKVPERKTAKNRLHIDLRPDDQEAEVERLVDMGARHVDVGQGDVSWVVLADPEGNEFCVLSGRSPAQEAAT